MSGAATTSPGGPAAEPAGAGDVLRSLVFAGLFYPATAAMSVAFALLIWLPPRRLQAVCMLWVTVFEGLSRHVLGIRHRVETDPAAAEAIANGPVIYAAKHQSMWETVIFARLFARPAFILKRELTRIPLFGQLLARCGMVAVDRAAGSAALRRMVRDASARLDAGRSLVIYPQGTRVPPGESRPYLPGVAALYTRLDAPVIPVAIDSGRVWPRHRFAKRPGVITVRLLAPIEPGLDRKQFLAALESRIESACG